MHTTPGLSAVRRWWNHLQVGGRRLCTVFPTPLDAVVWQAVSALGFTLLVSFGMYFVLRGGLAATPRTAVFVVMMAAPLAVAGRVGWRVGTIASTHPDFTLASQSARGAEMSGESMSALSSDSPAPAGWAWWRLLPSVLQSFLGLTGIGALVSGIVITFGWVIALRVFHLAALPLGTVALYFLPMVVVVSYFGSLAQTGAAMVAVLWRESTRQIESPTARRSHTVRGLLVLSGFVIVAVGPVEVLTLPLALLMSVTWTAIFLYLFFLLTQLQFMNMARPLTLEEAAEIVPAEIENDPFTSVLVATAGVRSTAMATGVWPIRRIYVGEALLEDDALSVGEVLAVVAHERAHHELGHLWLTLGAGLVFLWAVGGVFAFLGFTYQLGGVVIGSIAFGLRHVIVRWMRQAELAADAYAGRVAGSENVIEALEKVKEIQPEGLSGSDDDRQDGPLTSESPSGTGSRRETTSMAETVVTPRVDSVISELFIRVHPSLEDRIEALENQ